MPKRRHFTAEFKAQVVLQVLTGAKSSAEICREHGLGAPLLSSWKVAFLEQAALVFQGDERRSAEQTRVAELERLVGRQTLELEILKKPPASWALPDAETGADDATGPVLSGQDGLSALGRVTQQLLLPCSRATGDHPPRCRAASGRAVAHLRLSPANSTTAS